MIYLGKFIKYEPERKVVPYANHLRNENGIDWYEISWDKERTGSSLFICTDDEGYIVSSTKEGNMLFPSGLKVYQVTNKEELYDLSLDEFKYGMIVDNCFVSKDKVERFYINKNKLAKKKVLKEITDYINIKNTELTLFGLSDDDKKILEKYINLYKKIILLDVNDINMVIPDL